MSDNTFVFTKEEYNAFLSSKYYGMLYKDKCTLTVSPETRREEYVNVEVGQGIDLDFLSDVYTPFLVEYHRKLNSNPNQKELF
tara:strand:- start:10418 stop:10666 length:249 start_codon:yes stop_codon:yes gene_type:complete